MYDSDDKEIVTSGLIHSHGKKSVYLTFDDGPSRILPQILDVLHNENVPATFFWQTRLLYSQRPWQRVLNEGHQIGTHSRKHLNLSKRTFKEQYNDLASSVKQIENITGQDVNYFRPPFGQYNADTIKAAQELRLITVLWKIASMDWELQKNPEKIITNIIPNLEPGAIILLHELPQTVYILPDLIQEIKTIGYSVENLNLNSR